MISIDNARNFVHAHGVMWERALWNYLFDNGPVEMVHQCLSCYKNEDGGWGYGLEHDIKSPLSNPLMLEFLLSVIRDTGIHPGTLLDKTPEWLESVQNLDGTLENPPGLMDYPHAQWWEEGQKKPDSITGNLTKLNLCPPTVQEKTRKWVLENLTMEKIRGNNWLFMAYHAYDYFNNVVDFPDLEKYKEATLDNIYACALGHEEQGEMNKLFPFFKYAADPKSLVAREAPPGLVDRILDHLGSSQREDGGWDDEHGLVYWQPYFSTIVLLALKRFGRL